MVRKYGPKAQNEVHKEMRHHKQGKHCVKNRKQAVAIGLSKARRKGAKVPKPSSSKTAGTKRSPRSRRSKRS